MEKNAYVRSSMRAECGSCAEGPCNPLACCKCWSLERALDAGSVGLVTHPRLERAQVLSMREE